MKMLWSRNPGPFWDILDGHQYDSREWCNHIFGHTLAVADCYHNFGVQFYDFKYKGFVEIHTFKIW